MAGYVGDAIALLVTVTDPFTKENLPDRTVLVDVYYGNGNPKTQVGIRDTPQVADISFTWNEDHEGYLGYVDTTGFPAGKIYVRIKSTGNVYTNTEYGSFQIKA